MNPGGNFNCKWTSINVHLSTIITTQTYKAVVDMEAIISVKSGSYKICQNAEAIISVKSGSYKQNCQKLNRFPVINACRTEMSPISRKAFSTHTPRPTTINGSGNIRERIHPSAQFNESLQRFRKTLSEARFLI